MPPLIFIGNETAPLKIKIQSENSGIPSGIYDAIAGEEFKELYVILGDNIFFGTGFIESVLNSQTKNLIIK